MKVIFAACLLLVLTITGSECNHEKKQLPSQTCTDAATPGNAVYDCFVAYGLQSDGACTASCLEVLGEFAKECTGGSQAAADAYEEALETFCDENGGGGGGDDGSGDDAATVAATLGSTITALVVAIAAVLN